jgi:hypothetical protein
MSEETRVCGAPDYSVGCGREIRDGEPVRLVRRMERRIGIGNLDPEAFVGVGEPYPFHYECAPRAHPEWRLLPN